MIIQLLQSNDFHTDFDDITWCYGEIQPAYNAIKNRCTFVEGLVDPDSLNPSRKHVVIIDDLMHNSDKRVEHFFHTYLSSQKSSCFFIVRNLTSQGQGHRNCSQNASYIIVFHNREIEDFSIIAQQMFPSRKKYLLDSYNDACSNLLIDLRADTPDHLRLRGRILDSDTQDVYLPKDYICDMFYG